MALSYLMTRLLDTFLREDCWGLGEPQVDGSWLRLELSDGRIWTVPVESSAQLQSWRSQHPFLIEEGRRIEDPREFARRLAPLVDEPEALLQEVDCALDHLKLTGQAQREWFAQGPQEPPGGAASLLYHDRLASFLDHPYYPTARAKLGFTAEDLRRYAPEFGSTFELEWLSVLRSSLTHQMGVLPPWWPPASEPERVLVPVHPHTRPMLEEHRWERSQIPVTPTLSVRTVALTEHPEYHLKLPLFMRSLSHKNIRRIKPATLADGHAVQTRLKTLLGPDYLLTDESVGFAVDGRADLGCLVRRYPALGDCQVLPVASLNAQTPPGGTVLESLGPDFLHRYLKLTLRLHVPLWVNHGIALESNQQNTLIVRGPDQSVRLLLKDNDAARCMGRHGLQDPCMEVDDWLPIAQLFITITLQLNVLPFLEDPALLRGLLEGVLAELPPDKVRESRVREYLLDTPWHPVKHLFAAGTLFNKTRTGAADINKHYGMGAPNCFLSA